MIIEGNVGIGTTGPAQKLDVAGNIQASNAGLGNGGTWTSFSASGAQLGATGVLAGGGIGYGGNSTTVIAAGSGMPLVFKVNTTELMRMSSTGGLALGTTYVGTDPGAGNMIIAGNVGIGTTGQGVKLDVKGGAINQEGSAGINGYLWTNSGNLASTTNLNPGVLLLKGTTTSKYGMDLGYNGTWRTRIFTADNTDIAFSRLQADPDDQTDFLELMTIKASGKVGIGTTSPGNTLTVS